MFFLTFLIFNGILETNSVLPIIKEGFVTSILSYCVAMVFSDDGINVKMSGDK